MEYFIVMIDFGRERQAIVEPELTKRNVIDRIASGDYERERIAFIHHVRDCTVEDVTSELIEAAGMPEVEAIPFDHQAAAWDRARDYAKQG